MRNVIRYPDPRLKAVCSPAAELSTVDIDRIITDLVDTMRSFPGCVGIAAPQIGELVRIAVVDVTGHKRAESCAGLLALIDPVIIDAQGSVHMREGCLSIPDFTANVTRAESITVRSVRGGGDESIETSCDAYEARVVLHELDHLDGLLFLDRVNRASDVFPRKRYR